MEIYITMERDEYGTSVFLRYFENIDDAREHYRFRVQDKHYTGTMAGIERYDTDKRKAKFCSVVSGFEKTRQMTEYAKLKKKRSLDVYDEAGIREKFPLVFGLYEEYLKALNDEEE